VAVLGVAGCGAPPPFDAPSAPPSVSAHAGVVDAARIERVRFDLPAGYEVADLSGRAAPLALWGLGPDWTADPSGCGVLADPVVDPASTRGWSGSGPGGIVYAVVAGGADAPDPALPAECGQWSVTSGRATGAVTLVDAPAVPAATTVGMSSAVTTLVEGGNETRSHADTFVAYLGDHLASVTLVTDPGSPSPLLDAHFAAGLLVKAVSALRS
jgi:Domain of unknown function (DUF5642)